MELILESNNEQSIAKILTLAKKLNVTIRKNETVNNDGSKDAIKERILKFKATKPSSFGDAQVWERGQRSDRDLVRFS